MYKYSRMICILTYNIINIYINHMKVNYKSNIIPQNIFLIINNILFTTNRTTALTFLNLVQILTETTHRSFSDSYPHNIQYTELR